MMNIDDEDANLRLALGSTSYKTETRLKNSWGASANAGARVNMAFAASDPLSELVWSPHNGLSLKCANTHAADKKPLVLWNVGSSDKDLSPSQSMRSNGSGDGNAVDQEKLNISPTVLDENDVLDDKAVLIRHSRRPELESNSIMMEGGGAEAAILKENCTDNVDEDLCRPRNVQITGLAEISKNAAGPNTLADVITDFESDKTILNRLFSTEHKGKMDITISKCSEPITTKLSEACVCSFPNSQPPKKPSSGDFNYNITNMPLPISALPLKQLESSAENDQQDSRACLYWEKGKEKALSDGDIYGRSSNSENDSHESAESCSSARLFSKGIKRRSDDDQGLIIGSKRVRKQTKDSSFMNWILNMVKGLPDTAVKENPSSLAMTLDCSNDGYGNRTHDYAIPNTGFQTVFQSLCCRNTNILNNGVRKENDFIEESRELVDGEKLSPRDFPTSCDKSDDNVCKHIVVSDKERNPTIVGRTSKPWIFSTDIHCSPYAYASKQMNSTEAKKSIPKKITPRNSLWITRFSTRTPRFERCDEFTQETNECSTKVKLDRIDKQSSEASVDIKLTGKVRPILPSEKLKNSVAIASVFAKRLEALRHIIPSKRRNSSTCSVTCFFCGLGHDWRECRDVAKNELKDLVMKMGSFDDVEDCSCLCIRCFKLDHWAVSCPLAPSNGRSRAERNGSFISRYPICHLQLSAGKRVSTSNEIGTSNAATLANNVECNKKFSLRNIVTAENNVAQSEIFHAIRNLRLSRSDILRWMNSNISLSCLNGFFLRFRLGKVEEGLGETCYYVACITGDAGEHNGCMSKKSILVDVGGIKSSVGSQYVSNHDFLEDEIKAWWCRTVDSGCKIPSLDELNSKLNDRKSLGF